MTKFELKTNPWGDEYSSGTYVSILADGKEIWQSGWYEYYPEEIDCLRAEVKDRLDNLLGPVVYDISSYYINEWKIL